MRVLRVIGYVSVLCLLPVFGRVETARAQSQQTADQAAAEALFQEGVALLTDKKYKEACPKLEESVRLERAPGALLNLASCYEAIGKTASAWALYIEVRDILRRRADKDPRVEMADKRAADLFPKLAKLTIVVPDNVRVPNLIVKRDGSELREPQWGTAIPVDPGEHVIEVSAVGKKTQRHTVQVEAGKVDSSVTIAVLDTDPSVATAPTGSAGSSATGLDLPKPPPDPGWSTQRKVGAAAAGVGGLGLLIGGIIGSLAASKNGQLSDYCIAGDPPQCNSAGMGIAADVKMLGAVSTATLVAGGVLAAGGIVLWVIAPSASTAEKPQKSATTLRVGPTGLTVQGSW
ncbi:MAG: tetratricopeptide repeat protein [Polyangiaceae bacterium]|nr:tetratricopeptide repeat protein [Polyangiaceae bacterium]